MPGAKLINGRPVFGPPRPPRQNYILSIHLEPIRITNPAIRRTISCPATATFHELHQAIQISFGWVTTHTFDFKIKDPNAPREEDEDSDESMMDMVRSMTPGMVSTSPKRNLLRIVEEENDRGMGRGFGRIRVDSAFGNARRHADTPEKMSKDVRIYDVLDDARYRDLPLEYEYDFGDSWCHEIKVIGREEPTEYFKCTDGEGHGVAEDVGSTRGWEELKQAYRSARPTKEQKENMLWFETQASNKDSKGLRNGRDTVWHKDYVNRLLAEV